MSHPGFVTEVNNPKAYKLGFVKMMEKGGRFVVDPLPHKTAFIIRYGCATKFSDLKVALDQAVRANIGSVLLTSRKTGVLRVLNKKSNRKKWVRYN